MERFYKALTSGKKNEVLPEEFDFFGKLIGSWNIDYVDNSTSHVIKGEWLSLIHISIPTGRR